MDFYHKWNDDKEDAYYMKAYLSKSKESREVFWNGTEDEVKFACDFLKKNSNGELYKSS